MGFVIQAPHYKLFIFLFLVKYYMTEFVLYFTLQFNCE